MFKTLITLARGRSHDAAQSLADANALAILRQQIRDSAAGVEGARRALALVMAYARREEKSLERISSQMEELEGRTLAALAKDREDLATEGAAAIAGLEAERMTAERALATYQTEIAKLRGQLSRSEERLRELQRGSRIADAAQRSQHLRGVIPNGTMASLDEAEATLSRLQERQIIAESAALSVDELSAGTSAETVSARLAASGCGPAIRPDAAAVLERLKSRQN